MRMSRKQTPISTQYELSGQLLEGSFIIYMNARESTIITQYIRYIQLTLNVNSYIHYNDIITYKYIFAQKHIHIQAKISYTLVTPEILA